MRRDLSIYPLFSFFLYIYIVSLFHSLSLSLCLLVFFSFCTIVIYFSFLPREHREFVRLYCLFPAALLSRSRRRRAFRVTARAFYKAVHNERRVSRREGHETGR